MNTDKIDETIESICELIKKKAKKDTDNSKSIAQLTLSLAELVSAREQYSGF